LKTSVRKGTGSMSGYVCIRAIFQNGSYPSFPHEFVQRLKIELQNFNYENKPLFSSISEISVYGISDEKTQYKKERKPKPADDSKPMKGWGSKNSQMRLDKATRRNAKRLKAGTTARYW
jgi:hypothetical protein